MVASSDDPALSEEREAFPFAGDPPSQAHPKIVTLIRHMQALAPGQHALPGRQHFDPLRVPALLPHLWLIDVVREDPRLYRIRLVGGGIVDAGTPLRRGKFIAEVAAGEEKAVFHQLFDQILATRQIDWRRGPSVVPHQKYIAGLERVVIPLATDGEAVDMLIGMTLFFWQDGRVY